MKRETASRFRTGVALSLLLLAVPATAAEGDVRAAAEALTARADRELKQHTAESLPIAISLYQEAIALWRQAGDAAAEAGAGIELGRAYQAQGEMQHSVAAYEGALTAARRGGETLLEIRSLLGIGMALGASGEGRQAIARLEQAREVLRRHPDAQYEADVLFHIAVARERLGEYQEALERYHEVLALFRAAGNRRGEAAARNNLGTVAFELGDLEQSRRFYQQVVVMRRQLGDAAGEARALTRVGEVDQARGEPRQAREHFQRALALAREAGYRRAEANALNNLGLANLELGEPRRARELLEQALALSRGLGAPRIEAFSLQLLGRVHTALGEPGTAVERYAQALAASRSAGHLGGEVDALAASASQRRQLGELNAALAEASAALEILESLRTRTTRQELRISLFSSRRALYELYVELLMDKHRLEPAAGHDAVALAVVERSRARGLIDQLAEAGVDLREGVDPDLLERERVLSERLNAREEERLRLGAAPHVAEKEAVLTAQIEALVQDLRRVQGQIRYHSPRYAALAAPEPLDSETIREQVLDPETVLLVYLLSKERSFVWAVTRERLVSRELPPRAAIEAAALALYELLTARNRPPEGETPAARQRRIAAADAALADAARELGALVLGAVADQLGEHRLAVVGDGLLRIVPFAVLPLPGDEQPLITRHEVVHLPSASALAVLRQQSRRRPPAARQLLVLADPVFQDQDARIRRAGIDRTRGFRPPGPADPSRLPRLRFSRHEAEGLAALLPPGETTMLVDFAASRARVLDPELGRYRLLHFATHALIDEEHPELTGLALSRFDQSGQPQTGFLRLHEIYHLRLAAELVTLSACETALGKAVDGEGLIGLVRGFLHAGSKRVVASLWSVQDKATAALMERFYHAMLVEGRSPAAALRQAQIALRSQARFAAPYFWAAFVFQGEWR